MERIKIDSRPDLSDGRLVLAFTGWMDGGEVSTGTVQGLVDELGGFDDAIAAAAGLAGLEEESYGQKLIEPSLSPTEQMILDLLTVAKRAGINPASFVNVSAPAVLFADRLQKLLAQVTKFNDPKGAYAHCFCEVN